MLTWKNLLITILPLATTLLSSGVLLSYWDKFTESIEQPELYFNIEQFPKTGGFLEDSLFYSGEKESDIGYLGEKESDIGTFKTKVTNIGSASADNVNITIFYPNLDKNVNLTIDPPNSDLFKVKNKTIEYTEDTHSIPKKQFTIDGNDLLIGDSIVFTTEANLSYPNAIEGNIKARYCDRVLYNEKIDCDEKITNPDLTQSSEFVKNPLQWVIVILLLFMIGSISIIILKTIPIYIKQRKNENIRKSFLNNIREEVYKIKKDMEENDYSHAIIIDKVWNSTPYELKSEIIYNLKDYILLEKFFILIRDMNSALYNQESLYNDTKIDSKDIKIIRKNILNLAINILNIKWQKYYYKIKTENHYSSFLLIPLIIIFSIILTYGFEATFAFLILDFNYSELIKSSLESNKDISHYLPWFIICSFIGRSIISFIVLNFTIKWFDTFFKDRESYNILQSITSSKFRIRTIITSVFLIGPPSLLITIFVPSFISNKIFFDDPISQLIITITIPLIDLVRVIISIYIIRAANGLRILQIGASIVTLLSGLLYLALASNLINTNIPTEVVNTLFLIAILQIAWFFPMMRKKGNKKYIIGLIGFTFLSVLWIIILQDIPAMLKYFREYSFFYQFRNVEHIGISILLFQVIYMIIVAIVIVKGKSFGNFIPRQKKIEYTDENL